MCRATVNIGSAALYRNVALAIYCIQPARTASPGVSGAYGRLRSARVSSGGVSRVRARCRAARRAGWYCWSDTHLLAHRMGLNCSRHHSGWKRWMCLRRNSQHKRARAYLPGSPSLRRWNSYPLGSLPDSLRLGCYRQKEALPDYLPAGSATAVNLPAIGNCLLLRRCFAGQRKPLCRLL